MLTAVWRSAEHATRPMRAFSITHVSLMPWPVRVDDAGSASLIKDELSEYLELPQIKYKTEEDALRWWRENEKTFPNLAVMARQYLGCPASSASVERLFSQVGIAFSAKRKRSEASTLESIMFARANLP